MGSYLMKWKGEEMWREFEKSIYEFKMRVLKGKMNFENCVFIIRIL